MARVTIDDCLDRIDNRFALVITAAKRARQLHHGARPLVGAKNKEVVMSLREVAAGFVTRRQPQEAQAVAEDV